MKERDLVYKGKSLIFFGVFCVTALCYPAYAGDELALTSSEMVSEIDEYTLFHQQENGSVGDDSEEGDKQEQNLESNSDEDTNVEVIENAADSVPIVTDSTQQQPEGQIKPDDVFAVVFTTLMIIAGILILYILYTGFRDNKNSRNKTSNEIGIGNSSTNGSQDSTQSGGDSNSKFSVSELQPILDKLKSDIIASVQSAMDSNGSALDLQLEKEKQKVKKLTGQIEEKNNVIEELTLEGKHIGRQLTETIEKLNAADTATRTHAQKHIYLAKQFNSLLLKITHSLSLETSKNQFPELNPKQINSDDVDKLESFFDTGLKTQTDLLDQLEEKETELTNTTDELKNLKQTIVGFYAALLKENPAENADSKSLLTAVGNELKNTRIDLTSIREEIAAVRHNVNTKIGNSLNESFIRCRDELVRELRQTDLLPAEVKSKLLDALKELRTDQELSNSDHLRYWKAALNQAAKYVFHNPFLQSMEALGSCFLDFFCIAASIAEAKGIRISVPLKTDMSISLSTIEYSKFLKPVSYYDFDESNKELFKEQIVKQTAVNMLLLRNMRVDAELFVEVTDITDRRSLDEFVSKFSDESVSCITKINQIGFKYTDGDREATNASVEKI